MLTGEIHNMKKALGYDRYMASIMENGKLALARFKFGCVADFDTVEECVEWLKGYGIKPEQIVKNLGGNW